MMLVSFRLASVFSRQCAPADMTTNDTLAISLCWTEAASLSRMHVQHHLLKLDASPLIRPGPKGKAWKRLLYGAAQHNCVPSFSNVSSQRCMCPLSVCALPLWLWHAAMSPWATLQQPAPSAPPHPLACSAWAMASTTMQQPQHARRALLARNMTAYSPCATLPALALSTGTSCGVCVCCAGQARCGAGTRPVFRGGLYKHRQGLGRERRRQHVHRARTGCRTAPAAVLAQ